MMNLQSEQEGFAELLNETVNNPAHLFYWLWNLGVASFILIAGDIIISRYFSLQVSWLFGFDGFSDVLRQMLVD